MSKKKQHQRYIPKLIKEKLDKLDYPRKENLYTIIDLIHRKLIYYKSDLQKNYGYSEIAIAQFKELIPSSDNLNDDIRFLIDHDLIMRNEFYRMGYNCKGYKIPKEYLGTPLPVIIQSDKLNKRITNQKERYRRMKAKNVEFAKTEYYKNFKIDVNGANKAILEKAVAEIKDLCIKVNLNYTESEIHDIIHCTNGYLKHRALILLRKEGNKLDDILHRYMVHTTRLNAINDGYLFFKRNKTNGRLDTNLTSLPSFLRPYIISEERLMSIDIKNSQPYFLYPLLRNKPEIEKVELERYAELVINGTFYEYFEAKYKDSFGFNRTRDQMKLICYKIYYSKNQSYLPYKKLFADSFPTIMEHINRTNSVQNNTLAIQLQTIESYSVLDVIMPLLAEKGIKPYTIHDSYVCKESEAETIEKVFTEKLIELYGNAPKLKTDYIELIEDDGDIIAVWDDEFLAELNAMTDELEHKDKELK